MALPGLLAQDTVTRLRATVSTGGYGDEDADWTSPAELVITGCSVQPATGQEFLTDRNAIVSRWVFYGPDDADLTSTDRVLHAGSVYEVDGSVQVWTDPTGMGLSHSLCYLRRSDG